MEQIIVKMDINYGPGTYSGQVNVDITKESEELIIGKSVYHSYIKAVHINKETESVKLLKENTDGDIYTEDHALDNIERIK
jgi:hypothetical protein